MDRSELYYTVRLQNSTKLDILLKNEGAECLREKFKKLFEVITGLAWSNTAEDGNSIIENYGDKLGLNQPERHIQRNVILSGNLEKWDLSLLVDVLIFLEGKATFSSLEVLDRIYNLRFLKKERNAIAHIGSVDIPNDIFRRKWNDITTILTKFGVPAEKLDEKSVLRVVEQKTNLDATNRKSSAEDQSKQSSTKLEALGNAFFKHGKFDDAITKYTEEIDLPCPRSRQDMARLYLKRSEGYLRLTNFEAAKADAKLSVRIHPTARGFLILGKAFEGLYKFSKAVTSYEKALSYEPENKLITAVYERVKPFTLQQKLAHTDKQLALSPAANSKQPASTVKSTEQSGVVLWRRIATEPTEKGLFDMALEFLENVPKRNWTESVLLMEAVAAQELVLTIKGHRFLNSKKVRAEHQLGVCYIAGVGVKKDTAKGIKYFETAIAHGLAECCYNLGVLYHNGDVVPIDVTMAIDIWKLGAYYGSVDCIQNLAHHYASQRDHENAWNWYNFGISEKSTIMQAEIRSFQAFLGTKKVPAFNHKGFKEKVRKDVLSGRLKRLLCSQEVLELHCQDAWLPTVHTGCDPLSRKFLILEFRQSVSDAMKRCKSDETPCPSSIFVPHPMQEDLLSKDTKISLKSIFLDEMKAARNHTYFGHVLTVRIIEDAVIGCHGVPVLFEDERGNAHRATIFNFAISRDRVQNVLGFGCKISIINPFLRASTSDGIPVIEVFDPELQLIFHTELGEVTVSRCRLCGKTPTLAKCRQCKRCSYCSEQCLNDDRKYLRHGLVCIPNL